MKKVGIVGGTGPESTIDYYQSIISKYQDELQNPKVLPELLVYSIDMYKMFNFIESTDLSSLTAYISSAVKALTAGGCDFVVLAANTTHIVYDEVKKSVNIPMISIVEETVKEAERLGLQRVGLIGTKFTMTSEFFKQPFVTVGKTIITPHSAEQKYIHEKIEGELEKGIVKEETKLNFLNIMNRMIKEEQIEGIILGCTELPLLLKPTDTDIPQINTTDIHVNRIVQYMLET